VLQRATLRAKGLHPDVLVMTATPIPAHAGADGLRRSRRLDDPRAAAGRLAVKTLAKPESRRDEVYAFVRAQLDAGRQAYVIYPLVEESEKVDVKAATEMADHLRRSLSRVPRRAAARPPEGGRKDRVMKAFAAGELQILVSTTVVEVGVDVPNAGVMIVEHAERFGLSQLHQLRGRVGRDRHQSYCFLLYQSPLSDDARERLQGDDRNDRRLRDRRARSAAARPGRFLRHAPGRRADVSPDRSRARSRVLERAQRRRRAGSSVAPTRAAIDELLADWEQRFKLIEVGRAVGSGRSMEREALAERRDARDRGR
jgi:ATP-dependent DNA helicase RecG